MTSKEIANIERRKKIKKYLYDEYKGILTYDTRRDYILSNIKRNTINEKFLLYKLHRSLILKNPKLIEPYLNDNFKIVGLKPPLLIAKNHKELLLSQISAIDFGVGRPNWYYFKSTFIKINIKGEDRLALSLTYYIIEEPMFTIAVYIECKNNKIEILKNYFITKPLDEDCKTICSLNQKNKEIKTNYINSLIDTNSRRIDNSNPI